MSLGACGREAARTKAGTGGSRDLRIVLSEGPRGMDPADHTATQTASVLAPMYETLVRRAPGGGTSPGLARRWTAAPDGRSWIFEIAEGVRFHDGERLDAAAVAASFQRLIRPGSSLAASGKFTPIIGAVEGVGGQTVRFRLKTPYADFLTLMAANQAAVVSPRAARAGTLGRAAVGTGPFRFVSWRSQDSVVQRRDPAWRGERPAAEVLRWTWSSEPSVLYMALRSGEADVASPLSPVFARRAVGERALRLIHQGGTAVFWIALNMRLKPFDDLRVRRALNLATDRAALVAGLLGGFGRPSTSPLADATPYWRSDSAGLRFDPAEARRLLVAAGFPSGLAVALAVQEDDEPMAEALQAMWGAVGARLEIRRLEGGVYAAAAFAAADEKVAEGLGGVLASWSSGAAPDLQLRPLFHSASRAPAGANLGFFNDPAVDALIDAAAAEAEPRRRARLYASVQDRIIDEAPAVLLYTNDDLVGLRAGVTGVGVVPGGELIVTGARAG